MTTLETLQTPADTTCATRVEWTGERIADLAEQLTEECLDGADDDRVEGWLDYLHEIVSAAERDGWQPGSSGTE